MLIKNPSSLKLSSLAIVVCGLLVSSNANSAKIYEKDGTAFDMFGKIQAVYVNDAAYKDIETTTTSNEHPTIYSEAQLGIAGRSALAEGLDGIMMAKWSTRPTNNNVGELAYNTYLFAGLDAYQYGTLTFGRGDSSFYTVAGATDIFNFVDTNASDYYIVGDQRPGMIMYALHALGWDLTLSYQTPQDGVGDLDLCVDRSYAGAISTTFENNVTLAVGYEYTKFSYNNPIQNQNAHAVFAPMLAYDKHLSYVDAVQYNQARHIDHKKEFGIALSYGTFGQGLYASLVYSSANYPELTHRIYTFDSVLNYTLKNGLAFSLGYGYKYYDTITLVSDITLGAYYNLSPAFKIFAEGQRDVGGEAEYFYGKKNSKVLNLNEDKFAIGLEYNF